ncbi:sensor histidine kinase [Ulvibacter litoralis]|uniref:histidine kinase n=1 Tax=Ulvibacter litoralis TaxID=227084 RepID=A0A1G7HDT5_9FLAO|nr:ATP-binding protein [Ulvibacter litoralis]GHC57425.1 hypothetical protein GCM10008083_22470 [Ulvibacter litoralis]SDE98538.1 Signal transduction histidine kinase [Ulvibacter litoralis]
MDKLLLDEYQVITLILIVIGVLVLMGLSIVLFFYFSRKKIVDAEMEKATTQINHQKEIIKSSLIIQEEERGRIAQDLHDAISSKLNIVSLNANFLTEGNITAADANKFGQSILKVTTSVLESSRRIAHDLLPPTLEKFGLQAALEELSDEVGESGTLTMETSLKSIDGLLNPNEELHLFRMIQELLSNSIKYANATKITLILSSTENIVSLQYKDDGKGFNYSDALNAKGLGMIGLENRASILNANLKMESSPGNGVSAKITLDKN